MSCEHYTEDHRKRYREDFRRAILLKFKSATSQHPDIMTEADRESSALYQHMSDYSGKTVKTIKKEVNERFSKEWDERVENTLKQPTDRQKKCREIQRIIQSVDILKRVKERT